MSPVSLITLFESSLFFFYKFVNFVFQKNPVSFIFSVVFLTSISFTSTLILVIPFLLLTLGFVVLFLVSWGVRLCCFRPFQVIGMTEILQVINIFCRVILFWHCENLCFRNTEMSLLSKCLLLGTVILVFINYKSRFSHCCYPFSFKFLIQSTIYYWLWDVNDLIAC